MGNEAEHTQTLGGTAPTAAAEPRGRADRPAASGSPSGQDGSAPSRPLAIGDPDRYELAGEHARGGLGRVVRAVDRRLGRTVAVKELLRQSPLAESLFVREALITARLQHPGIVPVHEAGRWPTGEPYYVMKLVSGRTLKELLAKTHTPRDRLALLPHVIAVADAIGYAHSEQVIHRDLKPSNIVVGDHGETVVVDWGLARDGRRDVPDVEVDAVAACDPPAGKGAAAHAPTEPRGPASTVSASTVSGRVIGTPAYMAPEQARGEVVDERGDVYAIGAVLYEVLAGAAPYAGDTPRAIVERVIVAPPPPLADVAPALPPDLIAVVHKAMARAPGERYPTARELAADLRRFANGQLVTAHHYGTMLLARRWIGRHRGPLAVAAIAGAALIAIGVASVRSVVDERNVARTERRRAVVAARAAEDRQAELVRLQARTSLRRDPTAAVAWLKAYPATAPRQGEVADVLDEAIALGVARHVLRQPAWVLDAVFSPDGNTVVTAARDGGIRVYDVATGAGRELGRQPGGAEAVAWSPDGRSIAAGGDQVMLWPLAGGPPRPLFTGAAGRIDRLEFSGDGALVLVVREREPLVVIEVDDPSHRSEVAVPRDAFRIAYAGDRWQTVLSASTDGEISSLVPTPRVIARLPRGLTALQVDRGGTRYAAFDGDTVWAGDVAGGAPTALGTFASRTPMLTISPDGRWIALSGGSHDIWLYDARANQDRVLRGHTDAVYGVAFASDGRRMVSASDDATARVWDLLGSGSQALRGHEDDVYRARFSPDGTTIATASLDGSARLWDVVPAGVRVLGPDGGEIMGMTVADDAVTTAGPGFASRWNLATGQRSSVATVEPIGPRRSYWKAAMPQMSADGTVVASVGDDNTVLVQVDGHRRVLRGHTGWVAQAVLAADGKRLYTASRDGTVRAWDVATGAGEVVFHAKGPIGAIAVADDGRLAVFADDAVHQLAPDGSPRLLGEGKRWCAHELGYEPHGRLIVMRCDATAGLWSAATGLIDLQAGNYMPVQITSSPDGKRLAGAMADRTVVIWDAATGGQVAVLRGHTDLVLGVAWSPDGTRLASASYDHTVRVWDVALGTARVLRGHGSAVHAVAWIDAGARLISASADATLRIWSAPPGTPPPAAAVRAHLDQVTTARIAGDLPATPGD